jgi:hypothetical protein
MSKPRSYKSALGEATVSEMLVGGKRIYYIEVALDTPEKGLGKKQALVHLERLNKWVDGARAWLQGRP